MAGGGEAVEPHGLLQWRAGASKADYVHLFLAPCLVTMAGVFTPWKSSNTTNKHTHTQSSELVVKCLLTSTPLWLYQNTDRLPCPLASGWVLQLGDPCRGLKDEKRAWSEYPFSCLHPSQVPRDWLHPFTKVIAAVRHPLHACTSLESRYFFSFPLQGSEWYWLQVMDHLSLASIYQECPHYTLL